jgi:hypothetical protein
VVSRAAGHEFHAEHLQPGGRDAQAQATEAGEEAPTVPLQGIILFSAFDPIRNAFTVFRIRILLFSWFRILHELFLKLA